MQKTPSIQRTLTAKYGWTKIFGEHLYLAHGRCSSLQARIALP